MKVANSYGSLLRGVSQQVPQERSDGQHTEQVNMLSDPVNGVVRRSGSIFQGERWLDYLNPTLFSLYVADTANWITYDYDYAGKQYAVLYRKAVRPAGIIAAPISIVYNKTDKVFLPTFRDPTDVALDRLEENGVSSITSVGKYIFLASNTAMATGVSTPKWNTSDNLDKAIVWIRGGAYSRKYSVKVRLQNGSLVSADYTTPSSSYQGVLDTSGVSFAAPDYQKQVNDIVNAYNGAVTAWIGTSTAAIQPAAIALSLINQLQAGGLDCYPQGSHICFGPTTPVQSVEVDDGGDGTFIRGVADEIEAADKTSIIHAVGKVVKVRSANSQEAYYLKAVPKDKSVTSGYTEVTWVEGAGVEHRVTGGLFLATISAGAFYIASDAATLATVLPGDHPYFVPSGAGDSDSAPMPSFVGRPISYLGTFQNRLMVGSGGVLALSRTEDYLNFHRSTVLTLPADDPFELLPKGAEDDTFVASVEYDQNMVIFGKKRQYVIPGNVVLSPTSASMPVMSNYEGVAEAPPISAGGYIFYGKRGKDYSSVHQIQPGIGNNSPESFPASSQIDSYLNGNAIELVSNTGSPSFLFMRTSGYRNGLYVFSYLDKQDGRKMDSWSRWNFNPELGVVVGMSRTPEGLLVYFLRVAQGKVYVVADLCPLTTDLSDLPYLDSQRTLAVTQTGLTSLTVGSGPNYAVALRRDSGRPFTGKLLPNLNALLASYPAETNYMVGALMDASFTPTSPFMRDGKNKAIMSGRLTVSKLVVAFSKSIGFSWDINYREQVVSSIEFNGRVLGDPDNVIGIETISTGLHTLPVGRETRDYALTIKARRWYPLTITALEWSGQFFNRVQRF